MYRPAAFVEDDPAELAALVRACPLASLVVHSREGLTAAHTPMLVEQDGAGRVTALIGHVARANPFWTLADGADVLVLFMGPDAYVSPSFYGSKTVHGKVVPTWNYVRVEARGLLSVETDPARVRPYFEELTQAYEQDRPQPWGVDDAPADYIEKLQHAVVGLRIAVSDIRGSVRLSQNRDAIDYAGVRDGLIASASPSDQAVGAMMMKARAD